MSVQSSRPIKLKDKPGRGFIRFNLISTFGFVPEEMIVEKIRGESNKIIIHALLTEEMLKKEIKKNEENRKKGVGVAKIQKKAIKRPRKNR